MRALTRLLKHRSPLAAAALLTLLVISQVLYLRPAAAQEFVAVPPLSSHVVDLANMLDTGQRDTLNSVLTDYETRSGSQIAILLIPSTAPEAIEQYSIRVAEAWKLGRKGVDDGVLLIVAKDNPKALRRLRIESGRGVQGSLTDAQSKRILEDVIAPHFRQNDFYGGLAAGVSAISSLIDQEKLPAAERKKAQAQSAAEGDWEALIPLIFFIVFIVIVIISRRRAQARSSLNSNTWGNAAGVIIGSILDQASRRGGGSGGGFTSSGGFSSGGGSGGDSFSGGGGSFDGGGASGDW
jgi:uncharacterized protein